MKIEYSREKLMDLVIKGRKNVLMAGIIVLTLIITLIVYRIQDKNISLLHVKKDAEQKKNELLKEISQSEKTIKLYKNLLSQKDASSVMNTVSDIARGSNINLISIKPGNEENQPLYIKTHFIVVIGTDSYNAIGKFVSSIENEPNIYYSVDSISVSSQEENRTPAQELTPEPKSTNKLIVNLTLSIITFKG